MINDKLLIFTKYGKRGASSRLRSYQYFENKSENIEIIPLFDDKYVTALYCKSPMRMCWMVCGYIKRFLYLALYANSSLFVIEKELFPWLPWFFERYFLRNKRFIIDIDDAVFHRYEYGFSKFFLKGKFAKVFERASLVLAGNLYLANVASLSNEKNVKIFPTVVDINKYSVASSCLVKSEILTIVWIGSPSTQKYLYALIEDLDFLYKDFKFEFKIIGASACDLLKRPYIKVVPWSESTEAVEIAHADIGVMPLPDAPFERGKCGYKLIQYMACSLPVVASPVGVNTLLVRDGSNGFLCSNSTQWREKLSLLMSDPHLRVSMGRGGRNLVAHKYSLSCQSAEYFDLLNEYFGFRV